MKTRLLLLPSSGPGPRGIVGNGLWGGDTSLSVNLGPSWGVSPDGTRGSGFPRFMAAPCKIDSFYRNMSIAPARTIACF